MWCCRDPCESNFSSSVSQSFLEWNAKEGDSPVDKTGKKNGFSRVVPPGYEVRTCSTKSKL